MKAEITEGVRRTADKYIKRDGDALPMHMAQPTNIPMDEVAKVASFILWHRRDDLMGGVRATDAYAAFCKVLGLSRAAESIKQVIGSTEW